MLGHEQNPDLESYTAFVVGMKGTIIQFVKGDLSRSYVQDLINSQPSNSSLELGVLPALWSLRAGGSWGVSQGDYWAFSVFIWFDGCVLLLDYKYNSLSGLQLLSTIGLCWESETIWDSQSWSAFHRFLYLHSLNNESNYTSSLLLPFVFISISYSSPYHIL